MSQSSNEQQKQLLTKNIPGMIGNALKLAKTGLRAGIVHDSEWRRQMLWDEIQRQCKDEPYLWDSPTPNNWRHKATGGRIVLVDFASVVGK